MKLLKLIPVLFVLTLFNTNSFAETKTDCSQYSTKTLVGQWDKMRCKKGKPPREKSKLGEKLKKLNPFKKKT